jgi:transposase
VTPQVSLFQIAPTRGAPVLKDLLGPCYPGIVTSDRATVYDTRPLTKRQGCWAHLRRESQAMIDRGEAAKPVGEILLEHSTVLFAWWHWRCEGTWARATFQWYMSGLRQSFREELERGARCRCPKTAATCLALLARERALWTFVRVEGIDPTNNGAEVRLVGQKPNTHRAWAIGPGTMRTPCSRPQNLIPVSVGFRPSVVTE